VGQYKQYMQTMCYVAVDGPNREGNNRELKADAKTGFFLGPTTSTEKMLTTALPIRFGRHVNIPDISNHLILLKMTRTSR
jgi:hypothetical protein